MQIKSRKSIRGQQSVDDATGVSGATVLVSGMFPAIKRPTFADTLRWPKDITALSASNVSELLGKYTALYAYANQELAYINVAILELQTRESIVINAILRQNVSLNAQERWRRDASIDTYREVERVRRTITKKKSDREYTQMFIANFDRYLTALSRELSRKTSEQNQRY